MLVEGEFLVEVVRLWLDDGIITGELLWAAAAEVPIFLTVPGLASGLHEDPLDLPTLLDCCCIPQLN